MKKKMVMWLVAVMVMVSLLAVSCAAPPAPAPAPTPTPTPTPTPAPAPKEGPLKIAVFLPACGAAYFQQKMYGYIDESEKLGLEVKIFDARTYANLDVQLAQIEDAIVAGYDGFIVNVVSKDGLNPVLEKALKKGIQIVDEDTLSSSEMIKVRTSEDSYNVGRMEAIYLVEALKGKGNIIHFEGPPGAQIFIDRAHGSKDYLAKFPEIKTLAKMNLVHDVGLYVKHMDDYLVGFPEMDAVLTNSGGSPASVGIASALEAAGKKPGEIIVVNNDLDGETPRLIREGWISMAVLCEPVGLARMSVRLLKDMMDGKTVEGHFYTAEMMVTKDVIDVVDRSGEWTPDGWYDTVKQYLD